MMSLNGHTQISTSVRLISVLVQHNDCEILKEIISKRAKSEYQSGALHGSIRFSLKKPVKSLTSHKTKYIITNIKYLKMLNINRISCFIVI